MKKATAIELFDEAKCYCEENYPTEIEWAAGVTDTTFRNLRSKRFLSEYCWVVYASGFKVSTVESIFPKLKKAFKGFDLKKLSRTRSTKPVLSIFNNERKAESFLLGSKLISKEGFSAFKKRLKRNGVDQLEELPGIGPITKFHLAKNIGLVDEAKPDIWLVRAAEICNAASIDELVGFLSEKYNMSRHVVDVIIWRHGADNAFHSFND